MKKVIIQNGNTTYTRISKKKAEKLFNSGTDLLVACPVKLRPGFPFACHMPLPNNNKTEERFEQVVNAFEYYNCTCNETGKYSAFYLINS